MGECNRTACDYKPAQYYNHYTNAWYCQDCAEQIQSNADHLRLFNADLKGKLIPAFPVSEND